ncbi:MAG: crossover junction endodeoxyribonuclease RuvC [Alphaproteobacteria bacterium]|nr:crossover junction endodeoxyribonuclease RuvC [Alphaproteobacteria bacterium]MDP6515944.1 crossover junction endodeoxyribonuclease RuvC [Alphaproteobacteria bacterium]
MRLLGLDPGLRRTGWGVVDFDGVRLGYVASGTIAPDPDRPIADRLVDLHDGLRQVIADWRPDTAAVEETFVNRNAASALKLGQARGVVLLAPALAGLDVAEYHNRAVKLAVVGTGRAAKQQVGLMVRTLLPRSAPDSEDAADALAVAICHAHYSASPRRLAGAVA